ncbi:hypothetical protein LDENG_00291370, partial [Lucifuga dentata]
MGRRETCKSSLSDKTQKLLVTAKSGLPGTKKSCFVFEKSVGVSVMETCRGRCCAWSWRRSGRVWVSAWRGTGTAPSSASSWSGFIPEVRPPATDASVSETNCW